MILAIDTATDACSVALFNDAGLVAERHEIIGRGHAEKLVPMIAELPGKGRANSIIVDCGPGSFTGLRVGLATARALGLGWQAEVHGYSSVALMAVMAFSDTDAPDRLAVTIAGGHGEMFVQRFTRTPFAAIAPLASLTPDAALAEIAEPLLIGNAAAELAALSSSHDAQEITPRAAEATRLPMAFRTLLPSPVYGRPPDAKPPK